MKHRNYDVRKPQNRRLSPSLLLVSSTCRGAEERAALEAAVLELTAELARLRAQSRSAEDERRRRLLQRQRCADAK